MRNLKEYPLKPEEVIEDLDLVLKLIERGIGGTQTLSLQYIKAFLLEESTRFENFLTVKQNGEYK